MNPTLLRILPTGSRLPKKIESLTEKFLEVLSQIERGPYDVNEAEEWYPDEARKIIAADPLQARWAMAQITAGYVMTGVGDEDEDDEDEDDEDDEDGDEGCSSDEDEDESDEDEDESDGEIYPEHEAQEFLEALDAPLGVLDLVYEGRSLLSFISSRSTTFARRQQLFSKAPRDWSELLGDPVEGLEACEVPSQVILMLSKVSIEVWKALRVVSRHFLLSVAPYEEIFFRHAFISRRRDWGDEFKPSFSVNGTTCRAPLPLRESWRPSIVRFEEEEEGTEVAVTYEDGLEVSTGWKFRQATVMGEPVSLLDLPITPQDLEVGSETSYRKVVRRFYPRSLPIREVGDSIFELDGKLQLRVPRGLYASRTRIVDLGSALDFIRVGGPPVESPGMELCRVRYAAKACREVLLAAKVFFSALGRACHLVEAINPYDGIQVETRVVKTRADVMALIEPRHRTLTLVSDHGGLVRPRRFRKLMADLLLTSIRLVVVRNYPFYMDDIPTLDGWTEEETEDPEELMWMRR